MHFRQLWHWHAERRRPIAMDELDDLITENQCRLDLTLTFGRYEDSLFFSAFATLMFDTWEKLIK
jgi:hypothetical protein